MAGSASSAGAAQVRALGLSGALLAESRCDVAHTVGQLKQELRSKLATSDHTQLMLLLDGAEPDDGESLLDLGICAGETVEVSLLIYDPLVLVQMELTQARQEAQERSRGEAEEMRMLRQARREALRAERRDQVDREYAEEMERLPEGPPLMLTDAPAPAASDQPSGSGSRGVEAEISPADGAAVEAQLLQSWVAAAAEIEASYASFFDHISFRRGWKEPPFAKDDTAAAFCLAARIVARARIEVLDRRNPGLKLRQVDGSARDWMHSPGLRETLREMPERFAEGLVHATFKDAHGYVEGLTEREVSEFIAAYSSDSQGFSAPST